MKRLEQLIASFLDGSLTAAETHEFETLLRDDETLELFLAEVELDDLITRRYAAEEIDHQAEQLLQQAAVTSPTSAKSPCDAKDKSLPQKVYCFFAQPTPFSMTMAGLVMIALVTAMAFMAPPFYRAVTRNDADAPSDRYDIVAEVTGLHDVEWAEPNDSLRRGAFLTAGRQLSVKEGLVEITYRNGTVAILKGPAVLVVQGDKLCELQRGELSANVPPAAKGFSVHTPVAHIEDLGTEFGVRVAANGATNVDVFQGRVVAETVDRQGKVIARHDLTKDAAVSVSADARVVKRRAAKHDEFVTALPAQPLRVDFQHSGTCRTQRGFLPFTEADAASGKTFPGPQGPLHVSITGQESLHGGFFGRNQLANHGSFTYADIYNDFAFHNSGGSLSLTITGVQPNVEYRLRLFGSDLVSDGSYEQLQTNVFVTAGDTTGENAKVTFDRTNGPQSNSQHSAELKVKSTTNTLSIAVNAEEGSLTRLNGLELSIAQQRETNRIDETFLNLVYVFSNAEVFTMRWRELLIGMNCYFCLFLLSAGVTQAQILSVDFQNSNGVSVPGITQPGFVAFDNTHAAGGSGATSYGQFNVALSGMDTLLEGVFNRGGVSNGGSLTLADVYNDFAFNNFGTPSAMTVTLAGSGIRPNSDYDLTFYSYDDLGTAAAHSVAYSGTAGTAGSAGPLAYTTGVDPTTDGQYAATGTFTSNGSGVLTVSMVDTNPGGNDGIRFNALAIDGPAAPMVGAPILRVDFDDGSPGAGPTETGFENYAEVGNGGTRSFATTAGTLDVTVSGHQTGVVGGFFDRGVPADSGGFTFGELYRDYAFRNDNGTITVEIDGLVADELYELTWYVYDRNNGDTPFGTIGPDDAGNTTGDILTTFYDGNLDPLFDDQYAFTGIWSSSDTSLEFDITGTLGSRVRVNGFELRPVLADAAAVPEPASVILWSLIGLGLAGYGFLRRRRQ